MKYHNWDIAKNEKLKSERNISFEEIVFCISNGGLLKIIEHPNKEKYPNQRIYLIECKEYYYLVPFVESENEVFLKTIIPSRKIKKRYSGGN
jgi:uncharacterized DUF497 family protein